MTIATTPRNKRNEDSHIDEGVWDLEDLEDKVIKPAQWGQVAPKVYKAFSATHSKLPAGVYAITMERNEETPLYIKSDVKNDALIRFKGSLGDQIIREIDTFWEKRKRFAEMKFLHRRGYLLHGGAGTGKTSLVRQIVEVVVADGGIVLLCENPKFFNKGLAVFRQTEPDRNLVCVFEDIDAIVKRYGDDELLSILDGTNMVDRVLNIATTNFPEVLDKRIVARPRRFDRIIKVTSPEESVRLEFLKNKLPKGEDIDNWMRKTEGLSFASIAEAIISVCCLDNELDKTIKILENIEHNQPSSEESKGKVGFGAVAKDDDDDDDDDDVNPR